MYRIRFGDFSARGKQGSRYSERLTSKNGGPPEGDPPFCWLFGQSFTGRMARHCRLTLALHEVGTELFGVDPAPIRQCCDHLVIDDEIQRVARVTVICYRIGPHANTTGRGRRKRHQSEIRSIIVFTAEPPKNVGRHVSAGTRSRGSRTVLAGSDVW